MIGMRTVSQVNNKIIALLQDTNTRRERLVEYLKDGDEERARIEREIIKELDTVRHVLEWVVCDKEDVFSDEVEE